MGAKLTASSLLLLHCNCFWIASITRLCAPAHTRGSIEYDSFSQHSADRLLSMLLTTALLLLLLLSARSVL
jgi:hypothetical protein